MRVFFHLTGKAFLPEVPAYVEAFSNAGHDVIVMNPDERMTAEKGDVLIRFGGLIRANRSRQYAEIHHYASASTGRLPKCKNSLKRLLSGTPDGRIFVGDWVRDELDFRQKVATLTRDQGVSPDLLEVRGVNKRKFDLVYCGSISGRSGFINAIRKLSSAGFSVAIAGAATASDAKKIESISAVQYFGKIGHEQVPDFLGSGTFGLNYCPNVYPFRHQLSTKVLEYLVAGRPIISNQYPWVETHSTTEGYSYLDLDEVCRTKQLPISTNAIISKERAVELTSPVVLNRAKVVEFVEGLSDRSRKNSPKRLEIEE